MKPPRFSIASLMFIVGMIAVQTAILASVLDGHPLLGLYSSLDMGLSPTVAVLGIAHYRLIQRRGTPRPFTTSFVAFGWAAVFVYIICCWSVPDAVATPALYYVNEIEPRFLDADTLVMYSVSLFVRGLILALPLLLFALMGGFLARRIIERLGVGHRN